MAEEIKVTVDYADSLKEVSNAAKSLPLTDTQKGAVAKHETGAQLALEAGDLKQFQKHFNALMSIFKDAAAATGQLSASIKTLTDRQAALNKEINNLQSKKGDLTSRLDEKQQGLNADAAKKFHSESETAKKIKGTNGEVLSRDQVASLQAELVKYLETHKKTLATLTNADAQAIGFSDRRSAQAANKYIKEETAEGTHVKNELASVDNELGVKTEEYNALTVELNNMSAAATTGAAAINELYQKINAIGNTTNQQITSDLNKDKEKGVNKTLAPTSGKDAGDIGGMKVSGVGQAIKQFSLFAVGAKVLKSALKEAVKTVQELDKYLTEQAMVTGKTREQTYALVGSYQKLALQCGATTKEVAQVATEYMKQGKTLSDTMTLTEAAIKAAKVAGVSVGDSVNYLTTALNGFRLSADQAMQVSDKFAAIAAASATDYDELAIALSKVASQANLAGMSIDYTTALLTKGLETTREAPETMGTALKTIIARMRELGDYGETLDDGMDINNVESQLKYVGIALRDSNGELRSTEDVLDELGKKWDDLSKNQQAAVAKALAGTRQQARLIAMMEDYERVTELQQISQRSAGATTAQAAVYMEGMEAAINNITVAWEKLVMNLSNNKLIIGAFQLIGKILDGVGDMMNNLAVTIPIFTVLGALGLRALSQKMEEMRINKELIKIKQEQELIDKRIQIANMEAALEKKIKDEQDTLAILHAIELEKQQLAEKERQATYDAALAAEKEAQNEVEKKQSEEMAALKAYEEAQEEERLKARQARDAVKAELDAQEIQREREKALARLEGAEDKDEAAIAEAKEKLQLAQQDVKLKGDAAKQAKTEAKAAKDKTKNAKKVLDAAKKETKEAKKGLKVAKNKTKNAKLLLENEQDRTKSLAKQHAQEMQDVEDRNNAALQAEKDRLKLMEEQNKQVGIMGTMWRGVMGIISAVQAGLQLIQTIQTGINAIQTIYLKLKTQEGREEVKNTIKKKAAAAAEMIKAAWGMAASAAAIPYAGWIIAGVILAAILGIAIGAAASGLIASGEKERDSAANDIKALSAEIYKLEESARGLDTMADTFDKIDKKVIKTKEDIQAMDEELAKIGDTMSTDDLSGVKNDKNASTLDKKIAEEVTAAGYKTEKEYYDSLSDEEKVAYAKRKAQWQREEADTKRDEQLTRMNNINGGLVDTNGDGSNDTWKSKEWQQRKLLEEDAEVRDAFYAYNRNQLYDYIDELKTLEDEQNRLSDEEAAFLETSTQALLDNMDAWDAYQLAQDPAKVKQLTDTLRTVSVDGRNALEVLNGIEEEDGKAISLKEKVAAYKELSNAVGAFGESVADAFALEYAEFEFWTKLSDTALDTIDVLGLTTDSINEIYNAYEDINDAIIEAERKRAKEENRDFDSSNIRTFSTDEYQNLMHSVWDQLEGDMSNFDEVLTNTFGHIIEKNSDAWAILVNTIGDSVATTILDMGQQMESLDNTINNMYEKASEWNEMSESEKAEFISENAELFSGEGGQEMLAAFESGQYELIEEALAKQMGERVGDQLADVRKTLAVEMARVGDDRNEAYIRQLQEYEAYLSDSNNLYQASIDLRLEQEEAQLEEYRSYLEKEKEALEESLDKRKEAYEQYFDSLEQDEEDQDYEEQAAMLVSNLSKLGSSSNADAKNKTAELEQQLEELEKERLQTLRERAREAVLEDIDSQIEDISEKFDELLESNRALLAAMQGDLEDPMAFVSDLIASKAGEGASETELESYIQQLESVYGNKVGTDFFDGIDVRQENGQLILNVNGQEVILSSDDEASVYTAVMTALKQIGKH